MCRCSGPAAADRAFSLLRSAVIASAEHFNDAVAQLTAGHQAEFLEEVSTFLTACFDKSQPYFKNHGIPLSATPPPRVEAGDPEEEWRTRLQVNDDILVWHDRARQWAAARVQDITGDTIRLSFNGQPSPSQITFHRLDKQLRPYSPDVNAGRASEAWRAYPHLTFGTLVDVLESNGKWALGKIADIRFASGRLASEMLEAYQLAASAAVAESTAPGASEAAAGAQSGSAGTGEPSSVGTPVSEPTIKLPSQMSYEEKASLLAALDADTAQDVKVYINSWSQTNHEWISVHSYRLARAFSLSPGKVCATCGVLSCMLYHLSWCVSQ